MHDSHFRKHSSKPVQRLPCARILDVAIIPGLFLYLLTCIDPQLIYHWQGPIFYTLPGFIDEFLIYPGGPADYIHRFLSQGYAFDGWGAFIMTVQVVAVMALTGMYFTLLGGRPAGLVRFAVPALLLCHLNLYHERTPVTLATLFGLGAAVLFVHLARRLRNEALLLATFAALLLVVYYLAGVAIVFFAPAAAIVQISRRARLPLGPVYLLMAAALPVAVDVLRLSSTSVSARHWFLHPELKVLVVRWVIYLFYALGTAAVVLRLRHAIGVEEVLLTARHRSSAARGGFKPASNARRRRLAIPLAAAMLAVALVAVGTVSYTVNSQDRRRIAVDYYSFTGQWQKVIDSARQLRTEDFNPATCYQINLALHEMNRLGDEMFHFPQVGPALWDLTRESFRSSMITMADLFLRLGRVGEAEHFACEAIATTSGRGDPRIYALLTRVKLVKGQIDAARKLLTVLSYNLVWGTHARERLRRLQQDPALSADRDIQLIRRRMVRKDDMVAVWGGDKSDADMERLLLNQLDQDPSNRMAFEFLMASYLMVGNTDGLGVAMPRIAGMTGPAYVGPNGRWRTPVHYQEALAVYVDSNNAISTDGDFELEPAAVQRLAAFKNVMARSGGKEDAMRKTWNDFRDTYFFYLVFGPGDYR